MLIYPVEISQTASSGAWSVNTPRFSAGILKQILIEATTSTATFKLSITDDKGLVVYNNEGATGAIMEEVNIPLKGIYTIAAASASVDEAYVGRFMVQEQ